MNVKIKFVSAVLGIVLFVSGCSVVNVQEGAAPGVRVRDSKAPQAGIQYNTANIIDKSLQKLDGEGRVKSSKIAVESTNAKRTSTGTIKVWAVLRNRTDHPLQIEGRVQFFDSNKVPEEGPTAWQRVFLSPQSIGTYSEYSTKVKEIGYYYIEIREGR